MKNVIPLPQETVDEFTKFENMWGELMHELGSLKIAQLELESKELYLKQLFIDLQNTRENLYGQLTQQYGRGELNLEQKVYILG
jgi:hypothetical protein